MMELNNSTLHKDSVFTLNEDTGKTVREKSVSRQNEIPIKGPLNPSI